MSQNSARIELLGSIPPVRAPTRLEKGIDAALAACFTLSLGTGLGFLLRLPGWEGPLAGGLSAACLLPGLLRR